jgi:hypothetical protein
MTDAHSVNFHEFTREFEPTHKTTDHLSVSDDRYEETPKAHQRLFLLSGTSTF